MKKLAIWGWWQGENLGDNWIKKTLHFIFPTAEFTDTTVKEFQKYDFVICGGGGLYIYDVIEPWNNCTQKIPYGVIGIGAEFPHHSEEAVRLYDNAVFFLARDRYSLDCMKLYKAERSYDITFYRPLNWKEKEGEDLEKLLLVWRDAKELLSGPLFKEYIGNVKEPAGDREDDRSSWLNIAENEFREIRLDDFQTKDSDIEDRIKGCGFIISGRYHGIVAAIQSGIPFIAIDICPKIRALARECGLEDFCIKAGETDKVKSLIDRAKHEISEIREKERRYRDNACEMLRLQVEQVKSRILEKIKPFKIIHYGSYWMGENDVVSAMSDDLGKISELLRIDLNVYGKKPDERIKAKISTPNGCVCILSAEKLMKDMKEYKPDCIILNSGGLTMEDEAFQFAEQKGIIVIGISLSDPDVYPYNGQLYAHRFDLYYTNAKYSLENQYKKNKVNIKLMPFAASVNHHYFIPETEKKYDIVIVGHARADRMETVRKLSEKFTVGTWGSGWDNSLGAVNGTEQVKAINSGKMYLSFAKTVAGYSNIKVGLFEAVACRQVIITEYMEELEEYFEIGEEILCYHNEKELFELVEYYTVNVNEREQIRQRAFDRFLREHTWQKRWENVMADIAQLSAESGVDI